ncbi:MAG: glycosyltransferase family protein [Bacteroidales bacterium]|nr:glycosyltransferase family protein [Bacteroidales bacterium]
MSVNAIIQARCGSTRFPNKVFAMIDGKPLLWHVVNRLTYAKKIDDIVVATTINSKDDKIEKWCKENNIHCYRGREEDVLNRYYSASEAFPSDYVVRITADDPFKEPKVIDAVIAKLIEENYDHVTNNLPPSFPEGLDCEAFRKEALDRSEKEAETAFEREHVTQYIYHHPEIFKIGNVSNDVDLSSLRWTIDKDVDFEMVTAIYEHRDSNKKGVLLMDEILEILKANPEIEKINSEVERSAMYKI